MSRGAQDVRKEDGKSRRLCVVRGVQISTFRPRNARTCTSTCIALKHRECRARVEAKGRPTGVFEVKQMTRMPVVGTTGHLCNVRRV